MVVYGARGKAAERLLEKARDHLTANGPELVSRVPERHDIGTTPGAPACRATATHRRDRRQPCPPSLSID